MTSLKPQYSKPLPRISNAILLAILIVAMLGFIDGAYLTIEHFRNAIPPCSINDIGGCNNVLTSKYSVIASVPIALVGALYYAFVIFCAAVARKQKTLAPLLYSSYAVYLGCLASLGLLYLQVFVIHSLCLYCIGSVTFSFLLFGLHRAARS